MISFAVLLFQSCTKTEVDSKFDQNATERLSARQKELNDLLLSSAEGWKAVYYTDSTQLGGWTHLFKFLPEGKVDMVSDFDTDTATYQSQYEIQLGSTVSLVFTTKNRIHLLSDAANYPTSALEAKGYLGDFQFFYYGQKNNEIIFKTNRNGHELRFVKATTKDWADLPKNIATIESFAGNEQSPLFKLLQINDGTSTQNYGAEYNSNARFISLKSTMTDSNEVLDFALAFTPTAVTIKPSIVIKGQKFSEFVYDKPVNGFTATGTNGVSAVIQFSNRPPILTDDYKEVLNGKPKKVISYIAANLYTASTNSSYFKLLVDQINASLPANQKINRIEISFNSESENYIEFIFSNKPSIFHNFTVTEDPANKKIILNHDSWESGGVFIAAPAFLKAIDDEFMNPAGLYLKKEDFKIKYTNTIYTLTSSIKNFRMTTYQL